MATQIFLYEFFTGGGGWSLDGGSPPSGSLLREGSAMVRALAEDFLRIPGVKVVALRDGRLAEWELPGCVVQDVTNAAEERSALAQLSRQSDWTILIAPEFDKLLLDRCRHVESAGARLLSPGSEVVALAGDKHRTAVHLAAAGIRVPEGVALEANTTLPADFPYPAVLKPRDGAGSTGLRLVRRSQRAAVRTSGTAAMRLERWHPGMAASVALLCGPRAAWPLAPCAQRLSADGRFRYLGGWAPLSPSLAERAVQLARRVAACLPPATGYLGIDLVLGPGRHGSDIVIEINPRLTTSYLGLRRLAQGNLAEAMLAVAEGRGSELSFADRRVEFAPEAILGGGWAG